MIKQAKCSLPAPKQHISFYSPSQSSERGIRRRILAERDRKAHKVHKQHRFLQKHTGKGGEKKSQLRTITYPSMQQQSVDSKTPRTTVVGYSSIPEIDF